MKTVPENIQRKWEQSWALETIEMARARHKEMTGHVLENIPECP